MFDVIIRGGWLLDGTGAPAFRADVGTRGDRITAIGRLDGATAARELDATGRYVTPGFVDTHVHGDAAALDPATQLAALRQGVTTMVLGQDGISYAPTDAATLRHVSRYFAPVNGAHPGLPADGVPVAALLDTYRGSTALNTAYLAPHGTIRYRVMGAAERPPTAGELAAMRGLVERALEEGAVGLSTGLEYAPGRYADAAELAALCAPVAARGLPYVSHLRGYEAHAGTGMGEAHEIGRRSGVAVHASHYHGPAEELAALVDDGRAEGVDITFDSYPYLRGSTILAMVTLPGFVPTADPERAVALLADPAVRERLDTEWFGRPGWDTFWPKVTLSHLPAERWRWAEGMSVPAIAAKVGRPEPDVALDLLVDTNMEAGCVFGQPAEDDSSVRALLRHPAQMGGSDGIYVGGHPHPRGFGAFARILGRYTRELGDLTWPEAVSHLAGHPARRFRLAGRGVLREGAAADLVLLDPLAIRDTATYEKPREPAVGVDDVLVNGVPVLAGGALTGATAGRPLTP